MSPNTVLLNIDFGYVDLNMLIHSRIRLHNSSWCQGLGCLSTPSKSPSIQGSRALHLLSSGIAGAPTGATTIDSNGGSHIPDQVLRVMSV